jgi:hypothetical protein
VIPSVGYTGNPNADTFLQIYGDAYLSYAGDLSLPMFYAGSTGYASHGRYVFWSSAEDKLIVLEQADSTAKLAADYGVTVYPLTTSVVGCSYSLGGNSATFDYHGGLNTVNVTTGAACTWNAVSNASWISVSSGAIGFGPNTVGFTVAPNIGYTARNGTITIAGNTYTVTQGAAPTSQAQPISVSPSSGSASRQLFSFLARDAQGAANIRYTQFLISHSGTNAANGCYISYDPVGNVFYLLSDDITQWYGLQGGSANTIGNGQCTIYGATSGSTKVGTDLTTNVDISFRSGFAGQKTIYQFSEDNLGNGSGWASLGTWNDTGDPNVVELMSLTPNSGTGLSQTFTAVIKDGNGGTTIPFAELIITAQPIGSFSGNGCFIFYAQASNAFFLLDDSAKTFSGLIAGSAGSVSNSQCTLHGSGSGGVASGPNLTVTYNLTFSAGFAGIKPIYMQAADNNSVIEVWHQIATWNP